MPTGKKGDYQVGYGKPPRNAGFKKGQSGNPRGRLKKDLPALLLAALNAPVFVAIDGKRGKITKREVIVTQMVNNAAGADLRATKMLIDMMKDIERKGRRGSAAGAASLRPFRRGGDQGRRRADTGSPAARNPGHQRGEPGSRDDLAASRVPRSAR
jgi:hypothetical protein